MDPISMSTAIIPLVTLAGSCLAQCYRYGCAVANAPNESKKLAEELTSLSGVLVGVQSIARDDSVHSLPSSAGFEDLLGECKIALEETLDQIERAMGNEKNGGRTMKLVQRAMWPLKKQDTLDLVAKVERMKTKLTMTLTTVSTQLILQQQSVIDDMASNVQDFATQFKLESNIAKREKVLDWLTQHNPDAAHQRALRAYCDNTCSWILQEYVFQQWLRCSDHYALWLNGLAGYGKTVMTSFVIQYLLGAIGRSHTNIAYYYFDASDTNSLSLRTFLASIVRQYCNRMASLPDRILNEFDTQQAKYGSSRQLEIEELASILDDLLSAQPSNTIVVDGIDESQEQEDICVLLNSLAEADGLVHVFVSSRPEVAIRRQLTQFAEIQMSEAALEGDIGRYVKSRMKVEPRLARLSSQLKQHVQNTIQERSHGMFRWAQCQLDDISKLRTDRAVRRALNVLPQNLGDLYSLMLTRIPQTDVDLAKRALMILAHSPSLLNIYEVAEAAVFEPGQGTLDADDRLGDPADILEICGSLVAFDPVFKEIRLAHHSVRECLEHLCSDQSVFAMPESVCHQELAVTCLSYLLMAEFAGGPRKSKKELREFVRTNPLFSYAAEHVCYHIKKSGREQELQPLILRLFSEEANPEFMLWLQIVYWESSHGVFQIPGSDITKPQPLYYVSSYGLFETVKSLVRAGADMNVRAGRFGGTALHAAFWRGHPEVARFLLESGIDPNIKDLNGMEASEFAHFQSDPTFIELAFDYPKKKPTTEIPESLTSAISQAYSQQKMASALKQMYAKPQSGRSMGTSHMQYWQSRQSKKPEGVEDQVFEIG